MDGIRGLFSSGGGGREAEAPSSDPVDERMERVEQIASGVEMAAAALSEEMRGLRREATGAADAVVEAARARASEGRGRDDASGDGGPPDAGAPDRQALEALSRCVDVLEELHYRLLRIEVHPDLSTGEERERGAGAARDAVEEARELADSLAGSAAA